MASPAKAQRRPEGASVLETLPALPLAIIIAKAGPRCAAALACASSTLRAAASGEALWRHFCSDDFALDAPLSPGDLPLPSFKVLPLPPPPRLLSRYNKFMRNLIGSKGLD